MRDEKPPDALDREISAAALELRRQWDSSELWPKIERALMLEAGRRPAAPERVGFFEDLFGGLRTNWRPALVGTALFLLATAGLFVFRGSGGRDPFTQSLPEKPPLLTEQAAGEVELAEAAYVASIDKLSQVARPRLSSATEPVLLNYREKLEVLDSAINDLKANIERNRFNTHLREALLAMYKEKQRTLQDILQEGRS